MSDRTPTHVEVSVLDFSSQVESVTQFIHDNVEDVTEADEITPRFERVAIVETANGVYALTDEGVGPETPVTDEDPYVIDVHYHRKDAEGKESFSLFPVASASLTPEKLRSYPSERVNLAEFIRSFGARLEANYALWRNLLEPITEVTV